VAWLPPLKLPPLARLYAFAGVLALLIVLGTFGYRKIEGWSWFNALYKSVATLTSLGAEMPMSAAGRAFTMVLALGGIFTVALAATEVLHTIVTGDLRTYLEARRMEKRIDNLSGHVIVCGYGRVGRNACRQLLGAGVPFVVIDNREAPLATATADGAHPMTGDATSDTVLRRAGIARARALVAAAGADADNILITMTARLLSPTLPIVARAEDDAIRPKLLRAGATRIVSPYVLGGGRIAEAILRPAVLDFVEVATRPGLEGVQIEEKAVRPGSTLDGETVAESGLRSRLGLVLLAIKRADGTVLFNPDDDDRVLAGDELIVVGARADLDRCGELALSSSPPPPEPPGASPVSG
jgi:voltage-gated potassium channel